MSPITIYLTEEQAFLLHELLEKRAAKLDNYIRTARKQPGRFGSKPILSWKNEYGFVYRLANKIADQLNKAEKV